MSCNFSLPGITSIAYIAANTLPANLSMQSLTGQDIELSADMMNIPFSGEPTCECTQSNAKGGNSERVLFSFRSISQLPTDFYLAFLILDANGRFYLLGTKEEHPLIERVQSFGSPSDLPNSYTYSVQHTSPRALIPLKMSSSS